MIKIKLLLIFSIMTFINAITFSQSNFIIQGYVKYLFPAGELKGKWPSDIRLIGSTSDINANTYHMTDGVGIEADLKYNLNKKNNLKLSVLISYSYFEQDNVFPHDTTGTSSYFHLHSSIKIWQFAAGIENHFFPKSFINPFLNFHITINEVLGGQYGSYGKYVTGSRGGQSFEDEGSEYLVTNIHSTVRLGFTIGGGVEIRISRKFAIPIGVNYEFANLIGKSYRDNTSFANPYLNDGQYTKDGVSYTSKNISYIGIKAGVSFYPKGH
jgi:hypothetical protein